MMTLLPSKAPRAVLALLAALGAMWAGWASAQSSRSTDGFAKLRQDFGEQLFVPEGGFILNPGESLPKLVWKNPRWMEEHVGAAPIRTRWFNERLEETTHATEGGRYYAYGEARGPGGSTLRRAWTCVAIGRNELARLSGEQASGESEEGAVAVAALLDAGKPIPEPRPGQWMMENATRHVRLKRKLMGLDQKTPAEVRPRAFDGEPAPALRRGSLEEAGTDESEVADLEKKLDDWYAAAGQPTAIVVARHGVIVLEKSYGELNGKPVTRDTPMLLHSAMKPLIGLHQAMYVDRGHVGLDEPIGAYLPDFATERDEALTFRAGHVHATGIDFPWPLAFSRLFYFRTWQDSMIAHRTREWLPGENRSYGVVGVILAVRALELLSGRNYWDAMERELFEPLGARNILPGGTGFSAENLARIGVLLANGGKYDDQEFFSEETYRAILPTPLQPYFRNIDLEYGIGLQDASASLGPGSYGHGGGCGTQLLVNPEEGLVFAMVRNDRGEGYKQMLSEVLERVKALGVGRR